MASIQRPRVADLIGASSRVLLEAPGGYGKTTVARRWAASLDAPVVQVVLRDTTDLPGLLVAFRAAFRRAGLLVLADAVDPDDPDATLVAIAQQVEATGRIVFLVDEIQRATDDAADWIVQFEQSLAIDSPLLLAGRRLPAAIARGRGGWWTALDADDLAFDFDEVEALLTLLRDERPDEARVTAVLEASGGWPAAVVLAAATRETGPNRSDDPAVPVAASRERILRQLMSTLMGAVDEPTRILARRAAQVPLLSDEVAAVLGGEGAMVRLADAGLPIRLRGDGWAELPDTVREHLAQERLPRSMTRSVATLYSRGGEMAEAVTLLAREGEHRALLSLVANEHPAALARVGLGFFDVVINQTPDDALARNPHAIVQLIRAAERSARFREAWFRRASEVVPEGSEASRAVEAELAFAQARAGDLAASVTRADQVIATADASETTTLGRAYLVRAYGHLLSDTVVASFEAIGDLERAVGCFRLAGERAWEAEAHQAIGYGCLFTNGAVEAAIDRLERSLALRSAPDANRSQGLTYYAEVLGEAGRYADADIALREARSIAQRLGDERSIGYAEWSIARLAGLRRDRNSALAALAAAEAHPGEWLTGLAGIDFVADAALVRMRIGEFPGALREIERAEGLAANTPRVDIPLGARARYETSVGDAEAALVLLDRLDQSPLAYRSDRWYRLLLRAVALTRSGAAKDGAAALDEAERVVAEDGDPDRIARQEPELMAVVRPSGSGQTTAPGGATVLLLGGFAVRRGGSDVSPPAGRPSTLVKLLALRGTMTADELIDVLWPEADLEVGRARLRNLLNRVRSSSGDLIDRRGGAVGLAADATVDAVRFETAAAATFAAPVAERAALGRQALTWSTGELLPEDRYADWADLPRERLARRRLELLDLVANDAIARGDLVEASQLLDAAITDDPMDEIRYVRLTRVLLTQGRSQSAADVVKRAASVANELGVEPGAEVVALAAEISALSHAR